MLAATDGAGQGGAWWVFEIVLDTEVMKIILVHGVCWGGHLTAARGASTFSRVATPTTRGFGVTQAGRAVVCPSSRIM